MKEKGLKEEATVTEEKTVEDTIKILIPIKVIASITEIENSSPEAIILMVKEIIATIEIIIDPLLQTTTEVSMIEMEVIEVSTITIEKEKTEMIQEDLKEAEANQEKENKESLMSQLSPGPILLICNPTMTNLFPFKEKFLPSILKEMDSLDKLETQLEKLTSFSLKMKMLN